jgi:hypothetical protein
MVDNMEMTVDFSQIKIPESKHLVSGKIVIDEVYIENDGIGPYEFQGQKCIDHWTDYVADFVIKRLDCDDIPDTECIIESFKDALIEDQNFQDEVFKQLNQ